MLIQVVDVMGGYITDFNSTAQPFKKGDELNIEVGNKDKDLWDVVEIKGKFRIENIEYSIHKNYGVNGTNSELFVATLTVNRLK